MAALASRTVCLRTARRRGFSTFPTADTGTRSSSPAVGCVTTSSDRCGPSCSGVSSARTFTSFDFPGARLSFSGRTRSHGSAVESTHAARTLPVLRTVTVANAAVPGFSSPNVTGSAASCGFGSVNRTAPSHSPLAVVATIRAARAPNSVFLLVRDPQAEPRRGRGSPRGLDRQPRLGSGEHRAQRHVPGVLHHDRRADGATRFAGGERQQPREEFELRARGDRLDDQKGFGRSGGVDPDAERAPTGRPGK